MPTTSSSPADPAGRRRLTAIRGAEYLGSHPSASASLPGVDVAFTTDGVRFERRGELIGDRSWAEVVDLGVDGTVTSRRANLLRVFALGLLGWLFPSRTDTALMRLDTTDGSRVFGVDDLSTDELRRGLAQLARTTANEELPWQPL